MGMRMKAVGNGPTMGLLYTFGTGDVRTKIGIPFSGEDNH